MADATVLAQPAVDTIVAEDIVTIQIDPPIAAVPGLASARPNGRVHYRLRVVWASGRVEIREGDVSDGDFAANTTAFLQAGAKKKFLQSLVALGYEPNLIPQ